MAAGEVDKKKMKPSIVKKRNHIKSKYPDWRSPAGAAPTSHSATIHN